MRNYLFTTFTVLFFAFPGGSTTCLSRARGQEILMLETGSGCFLSHCRPRRGQIDSGATPSNHCSAVRHDASLELASGLRQKKPPTPRRGMAANPKKHRIFNGVK
jgi:hypothetical protein